MVQYISKRWKISSFYFSYFFALALLKHFPCKIFQVKEFCQRIWKNSVLFNFAGSPMVIRQYYNLTIQKLTPGCLVFFSYLDSQNNIHGKNPAMTIPECLSEIGKNVLQKTCQLDFNLHKVLINTTYTAID